MLYLLTPLSKLEQLDNDGVYFSSSSSVTPEPKENPNSKLCGFHFLIHELMIFSLSETWPLFVWVTRKSKMACLTKVNMLSFVLMQIILKWSCICHVSWLKTPLLCVQKCTLREMFCLAVSHLSEILFLLVQLFPFPKQPFVPVSIYAKHLMYLWTSVWLVCCTDIKGISLDWKVDYTYFFVCSHIFTGFVFYMFSCASLCGEEKGEDCF